MMDFEIPSFEKLYESYHLRLYTTVVKFLGRCMGPVDRGLAEDICQETWIVVAKKRTRFRPKDGAEIFSWIVGIARNKIGDRLRPSRRWRLLTGLDAYAGITHAVPDDHELNNPLSAAMVAEEKALHLAELRSLVEKLPPGEHEAVDLVFLRGVDRAPTARLLGITRGALKTRLHRAIKRMQRWQCEPN